MKRLLSILIVFVIALSTISVYAIDAGTYSVDISTKANIYKVAVSTMAMYNSDDLRKCIVYFRLPIPEISSEQRVVDYKLKFYTKDNFLSTGYTMGAYKLDNGESLIKNGQGLSGMDNAAAVKQFFKKYSDNGIADAYIYNEYGVNTNPKTVKLTSYLHEIEKKNNSEYFHIAVSVLESTSIKIDISQPVIVEYTIVNSGDVSGYGVNEVKLTPEICDHYNADSKNEVASGTNCRAVIKAFNYEDEAIDIKLYVATYNGRELESLTPVACTLNASDNDLMFLTDSFVVPDEAGKSVKVFAWDFAEKTPLAKNAEAITILSE